METTMETTMIEGDSSSQEDPVMRTNTNSPNPLRKFTECKEAMSQQFCSLKEVVERTGEFLFQCEQFDMDPTIKEQKAIHEFQAVVDNIIALLRRDNMKVVFVGHTSNGKSTIINSMLCQSILPMGIGHTTSCFCSVEGTEEEPYMMRGGNGRRESITHVKQVANALSKGIDTEEEADNNSSADLTMVRVLWDKKVCRLLGDGVVLIDTPGLDIDEHYDEWIDRYCHDADVFVLVANGESTLKLTEKTFFYEVAKKLSKPNIFLLYNRWDGSDDEDDVEAVRNQHFVNAATFLTEKLGLSIDPHQRVFFVSAKEALHYRTKAGYKGMNDPQTQRRYEEFKRFEHLFETCISESAIGTKFESHIVRGLDIVTVLDEWLQELVGEVQRQQTLASSKLDDRRNRLSQLQKEGGVVMTECENIVVAMETKVKKDVESAFDNLILETLEDIISQFDFCVFKPEILEKYKERLLEYVGVEACKALREMSEVSISLSYETAQKEMVAKVTELMHDRLVYSIHSFKRPIVTPDQLTSNVLVGFKEDIEFKFSLGWHALGPRLLGGRSFSIVNNAMAGKHSLGASDICSVLPYASILTPTSLLSITTVVFTLITKPSVWKIVISAGGVYGALYAWEYLTFTNSAKERLFKGQFMAHLSNHIRQIAPHVALSAGRMYGSSARDLQVRNLSCQIDEAKGALYKEKGSLEASISELCKVVQYGVITQERATKVYGDMKEFYRKTLKSQ